ncbi:HAD family hydrolase [Hydrogenophaga sp. BPS33]|uniref:HAD family hydrolase n=1 Tax=Hydrogenophaga sp. BPS33 TaxID=2651974 RepID=UPI001320017B|nr:HAD family hydrolase [Hydrogenophaga sp. BPS33]QHE83765.1 HAD family hydrolase [Hydrogenophaga sp. BPS33]
MILIFDLDDTLYDELTYVRSGFRAVAEWGERALGLAVDASFAQLNEIHDRDGRGRIFDVWLNGRAPVREAVRAYRHHTPHIKLWDSARHVLSTFRDRPLYIVTDGHKVVQDKKLTALQVRRHVRHAYITHRYGVAHAKPSTFCFELIARREGRPLSDLVYVGDNPAKDFVGLNAAGAHTIRVLTGQHRNVTARPGFDAQHRLHHLDLLPSLLKELSP